MRLYVKLKKDSIMFNDKPSSEMILHDSMFNDKPEIAIWTNAGSAYRFEADQEIVHKLRELSFKEQDKIAQTIALRVAETVEMELNKALNAL